MEETRPKLRNIEAFRQALEQYQVSDHAKQVLARTNLVVMSGLAGGGRNTLIDVLVKDHNYHFVVSDTTRPPKMRSGRLEQDGVQYYFRAEADMLADIQNGEFLEAEIIHNQQVSGTSIRELERAANSGKIAINDFEFGGANNVARVDPSAHIIGLLPPSYEEWIRRFRDREEIHEEEFINRLVTAKKVLLNMLEKPFYRFVINDTIDGSTKLIRQIVERNEYTTVMHEAGKKVAAEILVCVEMALERHVSTVDDRH